MRRCSPRFFAGVVPFAGRTLAFDWQERLHLVKLRQPAQKAGAQEWRGRPVWRIDRVSDGARLGRTLAGGLAFLLLSTAGAAADPPTSRALEPPVRPACISSPFGWRRALSPYAPAGFHNGVDLPAPAGAVVHAAASGTITAIKRRGPGGLSIVIHHRDGRSTLYAHLGTLLGRIADGERNVVAGQALAHVGYSGIITGTHIFFAVFEDGRAIDPEPLLNVPRCGRVESAKGPAARVGTAAGWANAQ